jgi:hypothetical protein
MVTKRKKVERTCKNKSNKGNRYWTRNAACRAAASMRKKHGKPELEAFHCKNCGYWHIGTPNRAPHYP